MTEPVDAIRAFHNAFRTDLARIDAAAFSAAKGTEDRDATIGRYRFFNEILVWHAKGEEQGSFRQLRPWLPLSLKHI